MNDKTIYGLVIYSADPSKVSHRYVTQWFTSGYWATPDGHAMPTSYRTKFFAKRAARGWAHYGKPSRVIDTRKEK